MAKKKAGSKTIGRWVPIGMTAVSAAWKNVNPSDEHLIFLLDSATGEVTVCGDASGVRAGLGASAQSAALVTPAPPKRKTGSRSASAST